MKNMAIRILAALLTIWYSMSIIGFDVHTCKGSGHSFVVTFVEGLSCGDIHPEHKCASHSCCSHHGEDTPDHGEGIGPSDCCSDDYHVLELTGVVSDDEDWTRSGIQLPDGILAALPSFPESYLSATDVDGDIPQPSCRHVRPRSFQPLYAVWRI